MPLFIQRNDITKMEVDAIVNAANNTLLGGGGVDGAIHRAAGGELLEECRAIGGCATGQAVITKGYNLPAKYVIHTVGPIWRGGNNNEEKLLRSCFINCLKIAKEKELNSIAFPLISAGAYGYDSGEVLRIANEEIEQFLDNNYIEAYIVVFGSDALSEGRKKFKDIAEYIDDNYVDLQKIAYPERSSVFLGDMAPAMAAMPMVEDTVASCKEASLESYINDEKDESFSEMLLRKIDEKGMSDSECYKKANIDRRLFSKIRSNPDYKPSKATALAFAIALELDFAQSEELLKKAGYAFSHSSVFDIIIEYYIKNNNYNIYEINEALFSFDQMLLGSY